MSQITSRERISGILGLKPVDQVGLCESFWGETVEQWKLQKFLDTNEDCRSHFKLDIIGGGWPSYVADLDFENEILEQTDEWEIVKNGNGAILKTFKNKSGVPEHIDYTVKDRDGWDVIKEKLTDESRLRDRVNFQEYRNVRKKAMENDLFFVWHGVNVFEQMHPVCGHEYMLMGMALDPEWILDMGETFSDLNIKIQKILFEEEGTPDGIWYYEDMGFKERPFMSPQMYNDLIKPFHKRTFDYAHSIGCKVIVHSCGFIEPLIEGLIEAGMDCLQAMEQKAGMDTYRIKDQYGDKIALCGGFDVRILEQNDINLLDRELEKFMPAIFKNKTGYILHSDHSIPQSVNYKTYKHFVEKGIELSRNC